MPLSGELSFILPSIRFLCFALKEKGCFIPSQPTEELER